VFDGNPSLACTSPCAYALLPGRHTIQATVDGYRVARRIFELPQQPSQNLVLEKAAGLLTVTSTPPGATIFINGQEHPQKTPAMIPLAVGKYKIAVVKDGFPRDEGDVEVRDGRTATLNVELQR
jgi:PEGA domain-containing protein